MALAGESEDREAVGADNDYRRPAGDAEHIPDL